MKKFGFTLAEVFSAHCEDFRKAAFTLAEVLITLGIIGVVAAMTLPSLIAKYQMKTFETAFKKQYSVIQNTLNYLGQEEGIYQCYTQLLYNSEGVGYYASKSDQCENLKHELISRLKLSAVENDLKNIYKTSSKVTSEGGKLTNKTVIYDHLTASSSAYMLPDGALILMFPPDKTQNYYSSSLIIDVNGKKGPNRWGYDVFYMSFEIKKNTQNLILMDNYGTIVEKGGLRAKSILTNQKENTDLNSVL